MRVQESVARLAETPGLRPTIFVVVGDHAPPFVREDVRDRFSQTRVPYVVLMPRAMMGAAGRAEVAAVRTMESRPP
jgi:phosphoglycerol transferase MdoB-like AlkP superfamily enzyme